jgi:phosphatidylglycerophosphate synthase
MRERGSALAQALLWPNNLVTLSRLVVVTMLVVLADQGVDLAGGLGIVLFALAYWLTDQLDGWLARRLNKASSFGEMLDLIVDRWCDTLLSLFLLRHAPQHTTAIMIFFLFRIAPEIVVSRFSGRDKGMFVAAAARIVGRRAASLGVDAALALRTIFFAWALYGNAPGWSGLLLAVPALAFAGLVAMLLMDLAAEAVHGGDQP